MTFESAPLSQELGGQELGGGLGTFVTTDAVPIDGRGPERKERILVIKHGALGDFFFALAAMQQIAAHHRDAARIALLTTAPFVPLAEKTGCFDEIFMDERPSLKRPMALVKLWRWAKAQRFHRVYDLQNVTRTKVYMHTLFTPTIWNGQTSRARFAYTPAQGAVLHQLDRKQQQLQAAGLFAPPMPDLSFLEEDLEDVHLPEKFFLLVPGASGGKNFKKWPARLYGQLACTLVDHGVTPVIIGSTLEEQEARLIQRICPSALNLCGRTSLGHLATLGRKAIGVVGNDTGPFHILWLGGCPGVGLFSGASDPTNCGPLSLGSVTLQAASLEMLTPEEVWVALAPLLGRGSSSRRL